MSSGPIPSIAPRMAGPVRWGGVVLNPNGTTSISERIVSSSAIDGRIDPAGGAEVSQPEIPLLLAGAQEEVTAPHLLIDGGDSVCLCCVGLRTRQRSVHLELLEVIRIVEVDDERLGRPLEERVHGHRYSLDDEHVGPRLDPAQIGLARSVHDLETRVIETRHLQGYKPHIMLGAEHACHLESPNGGTCHSRE